MNKPQTSRRQHYMFAHVVLPSMFYSDPLKFTKMLAQDKEHLLLFFWQKAKNEFDDPADWVDATGLAGDVRLLDGNIQAGLITLPPPGKVTEAYFLITLYHPDWNGAPLARYYTLEYGLDVMTNQPSTVFCGWTADPGRSHFNMGKGPEPEMEKFLQAVQAKLTPASE